MKLLIPTAIVLFFCLFTTGCKKEKLERKTEEKTEEINSMPTDSDKDSDEIDENKDEKENIPVNESDLFNKLTNGVLQGSKEINVREFNLSSEKADSIYNSFLGRNSFLLHLKVNGNTGYRVDLEHPEYVAAFIPQYSISPSYFQELYPLLEERIEEFYSLLDYRMTPAEIAYTLYQKLCKDVIYGERNEEYPYLAYSSFSALGAFLTHKAVCQGYSLSYSLLLNGLGIETDYVTGTIPGTSGHAWNRINIDGKWYNVDATFDDASSYKLTGINSINKYFLSSDNLFYNVFKHPRPHLHLKERIYTASGNKFDDEKCVVRRYNEKKDEIKTEAVYADGYWYYLSMKDEHMKIIKSDFNGLHAKELRQLNVSSKVSNLDKLQYTKDRIYFIDLINSKYHICSIDYNGNDYRQGKQISYIEAVNKNLKLSQDESQSVHIFKGKVALMAESMLARLKLLYFHGKEDYFHLSQPQAKELETLIQQAESVLASQQTDDVQVNILAEKMKSARKTYNQPSSMLP